MMTRRQKSKYLESCKRVFRKIRNEGLAGYSGTVSYDEFRSFYLPGNIEYLVDKKTGKKIPFSEFDYGMSEDEAFDITEKYDAIFEGDDEPSPLSYDDIEEMDDDGNFYVDAFKSCVDAIPCSSNQQLWWVIDSCLDGNCHFSMEESWCKVGNLPDPRIGNNQRGEVKDSFDVDDDTISIKVAYNTTASIYAVVPADVAWEDGLFAKDPRIQKLIQHICKMKPNTVWNANVARDLVKKYLPCYKTLSHCYIDIALENLEPGGDFRRNMDEFGYYMSADPFYSILDMLFLGYK